MLERAHRGSRYSRDPAAHVLIHAYIEEERFEEAEALAMDLAARFPEGRMPLWDLMCLYNSMEDWESSKAIALQLLNSIKGDESQTVYNLVECYHPLIKALYKIEDWELLYQTITSVKR